MATAPRSALLCAAAFAGAAVLAASGAAAAQEADVAGEWARGDAHVHTDHSSDGSLPRQVGDRGGPGTTSVRSQVTLGALAGLQWMALADHRTYTQQWDPQWTSDRLLLIPGEEANGEPHATVVGHVDTLVDGSNPEGSAEYRHVQQSVWDVHAQDAVWGTAHPQDGEFEDGVPNANASVIGVDTVEAGNRAVDPDPDIDYAENRWNAGFRFGLTTSSDSHFTEIAPIQGPGTSQTLVLRQDATERATLDALRSGRTTTANGATAPLLSLEVDPGTGRFTAVGGDEVQVPRAGSVRLRIRVRQGVGTTVLVYASPGRSVGPLATYRPSTPDETYLLTAPVTGDHTWWRAEARGVSPNAGLPTDPDGPVSVQAATSPVFGDVDAPAEPRPEIPLPPEQRRPDGAQRVMGEHGSFVGFADVARAGAVTHVVAERHADGATHVVYRRLPDEPEVDLAPASRTARLPRVAAAGQDVWVTWQDERDGQVPRRPQVYLRHSTDAGRTWLPEQRVSTGDGRHERPDIVVVAGRPVVAWQSNDPALSGGAFEVLVQAVGRDDEPTAVSVPGKPVDPGNPLDARSARFPASLFPSLTATPGGDVAVVWQDDRTDPDPLFTGRMSVVEGEAPDGTDPDDWEVLSAVQPAGTGRWSPPSPVGADPAAADEHPDAVFDASGALHVVWDSRPLESSGVDPVVHASSSPDLGGPWSPAVAVGQTPGAMSHRPRVGLDPGGAVRAVWYDSRSADWRWQVATAVRAGGAWGSARLVTSAGNGTWPALSGGQVVFTSDRSALRAQRDPTQEVYVLSLAGAPAPQLADAPATGPAPAAATRGGGRLAATGRAAPPLLLLVAAGLVATARRGRRA